jgi:uncharacterized protein (DUF433 family)
MATDDTWRARIICDPELHRGEACVRGTRIPVAILAASLAEMPIDELPGEYPQLTREDIQAAIFYAAEAAHNAVVV